MTREWTERVTTDCTLAVTESGGLKLRGGAPSFIEFDADPQVALKLARRIVAIHDEIFEREKALREKRTEKTE